MTDITRTDLAMQAALREWRQLALERKRSFDFLLLSTTTLGTSTLAANPHYRSLLCLPE